MKGVDEIPRAEPDRTGYVWRRIRIEAEQIREAEPQLASFVHANVLGHKTLEHSVAHRIADRLDHNDLPGDLIRQAFDDVLAAEPTLVEAFSADIVAVLERDPACTRMIEPLLYFKGFHAIEAHRLAHWLYCQGRKDFAFYLQSIASIVLQTDIHPAVPMGRGIFLDHATSVVIGGTALIEDNVSILQEVTLGGTGKSSGDRHPKVRRGVLISAGAKVLGNVEIGEGSLVGAGSVVLDSVPPHSAVAGVPAKIIGKASHSIPSQAMDHRFANQDALPTRWREFYENTKYAAPKPLLVKAVSLVRARERALDLGSGALNETRYLLERGFKHVTALDRFAMAEEVAATLPEDRFDYVITRLEDHTFPVDWFDLVGAQFSLPFIKPAEFNRVFTTICTALRKKGGVLSCQFFGVHDEWAANPDMTFHTRREAEQLLDGMSLIEFTEVDEDGKVASGKAKRWHYFDIIAQTI